jgi:hypothetical protein
VPIPLLDHPLVIRVRAALQYAARPLRWIAILALIGYVVWRLSAIGWAEVLRNLPRAPLFYLLYAVSFMVLPFSEQLIFRRIWQRPISLIPLMRKRALNTLLIGYSGDLYFYLWTRSRLGLPDRQLLAGIKDSSLLSAVASVSGTILLVAAFAATGQAQVFDRLFHTNATLWIALGIGAALAGPLIWRFRHAIIWIPQRRAAAVAGIHFARVILVTVLQAAQWAVAVPEAPWSFWLLLLTVQMLVSQLPLIPNRELLFLAVGIDLTHGAGVSTATLSGLLVANAVLKQVSNLLSMLVTGGAGAAPPAPENEAAAR